MVRTSEFPEESELVVCTVQNVKNFGAFVTLDEYGEKEGFIHIRDVATGWVKYIRDYVREGQKIVCKVLGVDSSEGAHRSLAQIGERAPGRERRSSSGRTRTKAEKLMEIVGERMGKEPDALYEEFGYRLMETYGTLFGSFEQIASNPESLEEEGFSGDWIDIFVEVAKENVTPPHVQIDGYLEMMSPAPDGVDRIRDALVKAIESSGEQVKIQYVGAPRYRVVVTAADYKTAEEEMKEVTTGIIESLLASGGKATFHREGK